MFRCKGPDPVASSNGCKRCKYGVEDDDQKTCLNITSESNLTCKSGYFLDKANEQESNWTENICRPCHSACISCISSGTSPEKDKCTYSVKYQKNRNHVNHESQISYDSTRTNTTLVPMEEIHLMPKQIKQWDNFYILEHHLKYKEDANHLIGRGNFGPVYKGKLTKGNDSADVAIKVIDKNDSIKEAVLEGTLIRTQLPMHPHVHKVLGVCITTGTQLKLISPLRINNLKNYLKKDNKKILHWRQYAFCAQIASGMDFLSKFGIAHKKLMASSILVKGPDHVEVSSFGLTNNTKIKWRWLALECLDDESKYTQNSDIWSYGVTCWEIFTYCEVEPYETVKNVKDLKKCLESNQCLPKPALCDNFTFNKIKRCWAKDINERPNFEELYFYFFDIGNKMREGRKVVINPNQNKTTEILSNSNETTSTSILRKNETTLQKDEEQRSNKESIHEYMNLTAAEEVLRIEEGRQKSKIENPNEEIEDVEDNTSPFRRSNQEKSSHSEPKERTNPDMLIDVTSSYINLSKDSVPNDPDPKISPRFNNNENQLVKIRQEKPNKILDAFLSEILYEVPQNLLSRKCKLIFPDIHDFTFDLHNIHEIRDIASSINGSVKESLHLETTRKLATKSIRIPSYRRGDEKQSQRLKKLLQEIQHHLTLIDSPNIVQLYGYCCCSKDLVLVMELMTTDLKSLYKKVHEKENMFPEDLIGCVGIAVTDALAF
uniref:Protein kinase domain-containing protein n=1 Tax=Acrobeloides nanus TaxID=290746 RepID=A0A914EMM3_9BILA